MVASGSALSQCFLEKMDTRVPAIAVKVKTMESVKLRPIHKLVHLEDSETWNKPKEFKDSNVESNIVENFELENTKPKRPVRIKHKPKRYDDFYM